MKESSSEILATHALIAAATALGALAVPRHIEAVMPEQPAAVIREQEGPASPQPDTNREPYNPPQKAFRYSRKPGREYRAPFKAVYGRKGASPGNRTRGDVGYFRSR